MKKCKWCNIKLGSRNKSGCCKKCYLNQPKEKIYRKCKECNSKFLVNQHNIKYCNFDCRRKHNNKTYKSPRKKLKAKEPRKCPQCSKYFDPKGKGRIYCSDNCRSKFNRTKNADILKQRKKERYWKNKKLKEKTKQCTQCGKNFKTTNNHKIYCSEKCCLRTSYLKSKTRKKKKKIEPMSCIICGKSFLPKAWNQKYCGRKCHTKVENQKSLQKHWKKKKANPQTCCICGKKFANYRLKYCSQECYDKGQKDFYYHYMRKRWKNYKKEQGIPDRVLVKQYLAITTVQQVLKGEIYLWEHSWNWLRNKRPLRIDAFFPFSNLAFDFWCIQHSKPVQYGGRSLEKAIEGFEYTQITDTIKKKVLKEHGIHLLILNYDEPYDDVKYIKKRIKEILS